MILEALFGLLLCAVVGLCLWWAARRRDAKKATGVRVRYRDGKGRIWAEEAIDPRHRRPTRTFAGQRYVASGQAADGVWEYRRTAH